MFRPKCLIANGNGILSNSFRTLLLQINEGIFIQKVFYCASFIFFEATFLCLQRLHLQ